MARDFAKTFYKSKAWQLCRAAYIADRVKLDGGLCEQCRERLGVIVHHKTLLCPENILDPDVTLNHASLSYECVTCHDKHEGHGFERTAPPLCLFNANGDTIGILPPFERTRV